MARVRALGPSGAVSVAANTTKTLLSLFAPSNHVLAVKRMVVSCEGYTATDKPALIELGTVSGDGTQVAVTERQIAGPTVTLQGVCYTYSVEPTWTAYYGIYVHLQSGYEKVFQLAEDEWIVAPTTYFAVRATNPTGNQTTNIRATIEWEE